MAVPDCVPQADVGAKFPAELLVRPQQIGFLAMLHAAARPVGVFVPFA